LNGPDLRDLIINILAGIILVLLGSWSQRLLVAWRFRYQRRIWRIFAGKTELGICLTTRPGPLPRSTRRLSLSEVRAVADIIPLISRLGVNYTLLEASTADADILGKMNLLVLGSTFVNEVSREIVEFLAPAIHMSTGIEPRHITVSNRRYEPSYSNDGTRVVHDHAIVVRAHNPYDKSQTRWALMVMGCHGFGTEGAARVLTHSILIRKILSEAGSEPFAAVVSVRIVGRAYDSDILEIYPLPAA
jgi:hypothetical protein